MISGTELPSARATIRFATPYGGEKIATVAASKVLCGPIEAALANGVLATPAKPNACHPGQPKNRFEVQLCQEDASKLLGRAPGIECVDFTRFVCPCVTDSFVVERHHGNREEIIKRKGCGLPLIILRAMVKMEQGKVQRVARKETAVSNNTGRNPVDPLATHSKVPRT